MTRQFHELLDQYGRDSDSAARRRIQDKLWANYGVEGAAMVLDMAHFSIYSQRHGIVHYLAMVRRMHTIVRPIIERQSGRVVKFEADNAYALFETSEGAARAAVEINRTLETSNRLSPKELDIEVSIGIEQGRLLLIPDHDFFGDAVNAASRLGEDLARPNEILIGETAAAALPVDAFELRPVEFSIAGTTLKAYPLNADLK